MVRAPGARWSGQGHRTHPHRPGPQPDCDRLGRATLRSPRANCVGRGDATPAHQSRGPVAGAASAARRGLHRYRPALRRGDGRHLLHGTGAAPARSLDRRRRRVARRADRGDADRTRAHPRRGPAGRGPGLRRHELDAGGLAGRRQADHPDRARRGGPPLVRPAHARGGQPDRQRPPCPLAVRPDALGRRQPRRPRASRMVSTSSAT